MERKVPLKCSLTLPLAASDARILLSPPGKHNKCPMPAGLTPPKPGYIHCIYIRIHENANRKVG